MTAIAQAAALLTAVGIQTSATKTATGNSGNGVDLLDYDGLALFVLNCAKGTGNADNTADVVLEESATSGGTFTAIAGATFTQVLGTGGADIISGVVVDLKTTKRFIRAAWTLAGTTPSFVLGVAAVGLKKYR